MNIYIYSDESGVFDKKHEDIFVFGGLIFLSKDERELFTRKYLHAERSLRYEGKYDGVSELKACHISNKDKGKLFRATNNCMRFGIVIHMDLMLENIFENKKSKQRFLDYAYKVGIKRFLLTLIKDGKIEPSDVSVINVYADEHSTATNGRYELREGMLQEYKSGTYNENWIKFFPPIFPSLNDVTVQFCDSSKKPLIRAADIIANRVYHAALNDNTKDLQMFITDFPYEQN